MRNMNFKKGCITATKKFLKPCRKMQTTMSIKYVSKSDSASCRNST